MKSINLIKRVISLTLVFLCALTLTVPAMQAEGAGEYSITITANPNLPAMTNGQFTAYQIFKGKLNDDDPNNRQLADIQWGSGVNSANLVTALKAADAPDIIKQAFKDIKDVSPDNTDALNAQAADVADVLVKNTKDSAFLQAFAKIVYANKNGEGQTSTIQNGKVENKPDSKITVDDPGYYLVAENGEHTLNDAVSEFILDVLGNQTVAIKADIPDVEKDIVVGSTTAKGDSAGIGDTVQFKLTGTLPKNYADFDEFSYKFTDTLCDGLTFTDGSLKVKVGEQELSEITDEHLDGDYKLEVNEQTITVTFDNLKAVKQPVIDKDSEIIVTYSAILNEKAVIGLPGNDNTVYLEYSNDPNSDSMGKTTEKKVYVYDFGIVITKKNHQDQTLGNVNFVLTKTDADGTVLYAQCADLAEGADNRKLTGWTKTEADATTLTTDANGKFGVEGLDEGTYTLTETKTLNGYNTMNPITFTITPIIDEFGNLTGLSATVDGERLDDVSVGSVTAKFDLISMTLINYPAPFLPSTGGIGTVIFYVLGGLILAGVIAFLIIKSRKRTKEQEQ